ncbi:MAG: hypothetical protein ABL907_22865 [Hyphomicrobium sp.]
MKHLLGVLGVAAASVLLAVSAAMNWKFGYGLGKGELEGQLLGGASAAADCLKALIPFFLFAAIRKRIWSQAFAAGALWTICLGYSMASALGFAALNRADTTGERQVQTANYSDLRKELKRSEDRLGWMPQHRPAGMIEQEIARLEKDRFWVVTKGCAEIPGKTTRDFCQSVNTLRAEHAVAAEARLVEARVAEIQAKLNKISGNAVAGEVDPQAKVLAQLTGQDQSSVQMALTVMVALLLELGSAFGFYVAMSVWRIDEESKKAPVPVAQPRITAANENRSSETRTIAPAPVEASPRLTAPENDVERFHKERVVATEGSSVTATTLYEDYCGWCEERDKEPMAFPTFGRQFGELGVQKAKLGGRIRYIGIKLKTASTDADEHESLAIGERLGGGAVKPTVSRVA